MVAGLPLHPVRGFEERSKSYDFRAHDDHASGRFVARGIVEFRALGFRSRFATHRSSFRKRHLVCQAVLWRVGARWDSHLMGGDPILCVLYLADFPS